MSPAEGPTAPFVDIDLKAGFKFGDHTRELLRKVDTGNDRLRMFHDALDACNAGRALDDTLSEAFAGMNAEDRLDGAIAGARMMLNDWALRLGIGLISISHAPIDRYGQEIPFDERTRNILEQVKAQTNGLLAGIGGDMPRVKIGFRVSGCGAEWLQDVTQGGRLVAASSSAPDRLILDKGTKQPGNGLIVPAGSYVTLRALLLDRDILARRAKELGVTELSFEDLEGESDTHDPQGYICRYVTAEGTRRLMGWIGNSGGDIITPDMLYSPQRGSA